MLISIDWDFFIWNGMEAADSTIKAFPGTANEHIIDASLLFDWGHNESWSSTLLDAIWYDRFAGFSRIGLDMESVCSIRQDKGCVTPATFLAELGKRFDIVGVPVWSADSHAFGAIASREAYVQEGTPIELVLFDAHCDLGYDSDNVRREAAESVCDCGSWLWHAIKIGYVSNAVIVYPDWRGYNEWDSMKDKDFIVELGDSVRVTTWSEFISDDKPTTSVSLINVARSSNWTPPYLDRQFQDLLDGLNSDLYCLDCCGIFSKVGAYDACRARPWNRDLAIENSKRLIAIMGGHNI